MENSEKPRFVTKVNEWSGDPEESTDGFDNSLNDWLSELAWTMYDEGYEQHSVSSSCSVTALQADEDHCRSVYEVIVVTVVFKLREEAE
jgi:hypothetical protein